MASLGFVLDWRVLLLIGMGLGLHGELAGQCYDCIDDTGFGRHRMSLFPPPIGWEAAPNSYHSTWENGYCLFYH